jgi:patatin-like phospholipase/acyl hydrolase
VTVTINRPPKRWAADKGDNKWICAIDGGGLRGIFALRMLEALEQHYGDSCFNMFDMFAGTSTGSLIASMLASGHPLAEVIGLYTSKVTRDIIFQPNDNAQFNSLWNWRYPADRVHADSKDNWPLREYEDKYDFDLLPNLISGLAFAGDKLGRVPVVGNAVPDLPFDAASMAADAAKAPVLTLTRLVAPSLMAPRYAKVGIAQLLAHHLTHVVNGERRPLRLGDLKKDFLVVLLDNKDQRTRAFTHFVGSSTPTPAGKKSHLDLYLKDLVESSASAPVYFAPRGRFTDGGAGPCNNPALLAAVYALRKTTQTSEGGAVKYTPGKVTVWSFGTCGTRQESSDPTWKSIMPRFADGKCGMFATDLVERFIDDIMASANQFQLDVASELLGDRVRMRRFNGLFGRDDFKQGNSAYAATHSQYDVDTLLKNIGFVPNNFDAMDQVAKAFAQYAASSNFGAATGGSVTVGLPRIGLDDSHSDAHDLLDEFRWTD